MITFVMVNDRVPACQPFVCAACGDMLENGYVRSRKDGLKYCDAFCYFLSEGLRQLSNERKRCKNAAFKHGNEQR